MAFTTLSEDAANIASVRAKRVTIMDALQTSSALAENAGVKTEDLYEALATGRDKTDPDYWSFQIMKYLYTYMPFGVVGRWFVPIILGYGLFCSFAKIGELIGKGWDSLKGAEWFKAAGKATGLWDRERVAFFAENSSMTASSTVDSAMMQAGLLAILPPYAATIVAKAGAPGASDPVLQTRLSQCEAALTSCRADLADAQARLNQYGDGSMYTNIMNTLNPYASARPQVMPPMTSGYYQAPQVMPQARPSVGESLGVYAGKQVIDWLGNSLGGGNNNQDDSGWYSDNVARDRVIRDVNGSTNLGLKMNSRSNY